jgi:hypothetical protein
LNQGVISFFGLHQFAFGLLFGKRGLVWIDPRQGMTASQKNKQSFFSGKCLGTAWNTLERFGTPWNPSL